MYLFKIFSDTTKFSVIAKNYKEAIKKIGMNVPKEFTKNYYLEEATAIEEQYVTKKEFDAMAEVVKHHIKRIDKLESAS